MSAETEAYAALSAAAAVTALVSTRIYPDAIPEDQAMPAIVFSRSSTDPVVALDGSYLAEFARLNITAWATTRTSAEAIADAVADVLVAQKHPPENRASGYDGELGLFAVAVDCVWFTNNP